MQYTEYFQVSQQSALIIPCSLKGPSKRILSSTELRNLDQVYAWQIEKYIPERKRKFKAPKLYMRGKPFTALQQDKTTDAGYRTTALRLTATTMQYIDMQEIFHTQMAVS
jgi:hypothetical protein